MRLAAGVAALLIAAPAAQAAPPGAGALKPGIALAGIRLGMTPAQVRGAWGGRFGVCRDCRRPTWYFNYARFEPQGAGVSFRSGRVAAVFTIWAPPGWRTNRGLRIGDDAARATLLHRGLIRVNCGTYYALTLNGRNAVTSIYVHDEKVWGFGLSRPRERVCR